MLIKPQAPSLPTSVAPTKVLILTLSSSKEFIPAARTILSRLGALGIANNIDSTTASVGKRYAGNDELGTLLCITADFDMLKDGSVTLRERDSMAQVHGSEDEVVQAATNMVGGFETWQQVVRRLPAFEGRSQG